MRLRDRIERMTPRQKRHMPRPPQTLSAEADRAGYETMMRLLERAEGRKR